MSFKFSENFISSKSFKMEEISSKSFNLYDDMVPKQLRDAYLSQNSSVLTLSTLTFDDDASVKVVVKRNTARQLNSATNSSSCDVLTTISDGEENEIESWEMAKMCPNGCNCGSCPLVKNEIFSLHSLAPNLSTISLPNNHNQSNSFLSISYVIPLRNYGAIIRWNVVHQRDIRGYKIFMDGSQVSSVGRGRVSAVIENVNMQTPHHFAVTIIPNVSEKITPFLYHNMHAVYLYKPNDFIH